MLNINSLKAELKAGLKLMAIMALLGTATVITLATLTMAAITLWI